jgi:hypothetical protein
LRFDNLFHSDHLWLWSFAGLRRRLATVDEEHLTGREGRLARSEEDDRICDLVGLARTLERNTRHQAGLRSALPVKRSSIAVSIGPGATALIRTPDALPPARQTL